MGTKPLLFLLLLAAGLVAVLLFTDERPPIEQVAEARLLDGRSLADADRIRWQFEGKQALEFAIGEDGRFWMQEPIRDVASAAFLRNIVNTWDSANMRQTTYADDEVGRQQAGLAPPELKFIAEWPDGHRIVVEVGAPGPLGDTRLLRRDGVIWEGGNGLLESLHVNREDLRERQVFRHTTRTATELAVDQLLPSGKRETLQLVLDGDTWRMRSPVVGRADPAGTSQFLASVLGLRADYFQPGIVERPERPGDIKIRIVGSYGDEELEMWLEQGQLWGLLPGRDVIFVSENDQFVRIFRDAADRLRARILVPMGESGFEQLQELVIDPGQGHGTRLIFRRQDQTWRLQEPIEFDVRATPMNETIAALSQLVAREFVAGGEIHPRADDPEYGLLPGQRLMVTTRRERDRAASTLWIGGDVADAGDEPLVYVARADEPDNVARAPGGPVRALRRPWTDYVEKQVWRQNAIVERLELLRGEQRREFGIVDGAWRRLGVDGPAGDAAEVGEFADETLRDLYGKSAVDMREGTGFADEPDWRLQLQRRTGDVLCELHFWDRGEAAPLVVRSKMHAAVGLGFELGVRDSRFLRELWR